MAASAASDCARFEKLLEMERMTGAEGERCNARRLLARKYPVGPPAQPSVEPSAPTVGVFIEEPGLKVTYYVIDGIEI